MALCKRSRRLDQRTGEDILDLAVGRYLEYVVVALLIAHISLKRVAHIVDEELALDEESEGCEGDKVRDLRKLASHGTEAGKVDRKLIVRLGADGKRVGCLEIVGRRRNRASDGNAYKAYVLFEPALYFLGDVRLDKTVKVLVRSYHILADENIQRRVLRGSLNDSLGDKGRDKGEDVYSESRRHNVAVGDRLNDGGVVATVYGFEIFHRLGNIFVLAGKIYRVLSPLVEKVDDLFVDINEGRIVSRKIKLLTDEAASDIAGSVHYCFHKIPP